MISSSKITWGFHRQRHPKTKGPAFVLVIKTTIVFVLVYFTYELATTFSTRALHLPTGFLSSGGVASSTSVKLLYVTSYAGTLTTLKLTTSSGDDRSSSASLETISTTFDCGPNPSWVTLVASGSLLLCADEGLGRPTGFVTSYQTSSDGVLALLDRIDVLAGAVAITPCGVDGHGLAVPHYSSSSVSSLFLSLPQQQQQQQRQWTGDLELVQNETYALEQPPGPDPVRQEAPHPHDAILDPTGQYLLVPDLGADLIWAPTSFACSRLAGSVSRGRRCHLWLQQPAPGRDMAPSCQLLTRSFFYLISELANTITGYEVTYGEGTIHFDELFTIGTHGEGEDVPDGAAAAEIQVAPDKRFLIVSSRNESSLSIPPFHQDSDSSAEIPSDPLIVFSIDQATGALIKVHGFAADGGLIAVGLQGDGRVVVISRNIETGELKDYVAHIDVEGEVTAVIFDEVATNRSRLQVP